jgi:hypothetical protein
MAKDFRARQVRTGVLIASGAAVAGKTGLGLMIYSSSVASNYQGTRSDNEMLTNVGTDVWLFVSGTANTETYSPPGVLSGEGVTLFAGDVVVSGTLYAEKMVVEVNQATTGSLMVSGSLFVSQSVSIGSTVAGMGPDLTPAGVLELQGDANQGIPTLFVTHEDDDVIGVDLNINSTTADAIAIDATSTTGHVIDIAANALTTGKALNITTIGPTPIVIDLNHSLTTAATIIGLDIDIDKTGNGAVNNVVYGIRVDIDDSATRPGGSNTNAMIGASITPTLLPATDDGTNSVSGLVVVATGHLNGDTTAIGASLTAAGGDTNTQLMLNYDAANYSTFSVSSTGVLTVATIDQTSDSGAITLDTVDKITLDSDTASEGIVYADGGTEILQIYNSAQNPIIKISQNAKFLHIVDDGAQDLLSLGESQGAIFNEGGVSTFDFRVESKTQTGGIILDAGTNQMALFSSGTSASNSYQDSVSATGRALPSDIGLWVSGVFGGKDVISGQNSIGVSAFGGDVVVSGNMHIAEYIYHEGDADTRMGFWNDQYSVLAGGKGVVAGISGVTFLGGSGTEATKFDQVLIMSGGAALSNNESEYPDLAFFVSGAMGSKDTSVKGTALFGGDVVISGSAYFDGGMLKITGSRASHDYGSEVRDHYAPDAVNIMYTSPPTETGGGMLSLCDGNSIANLSLYSGEYHSGIGLNMDWWKHSFWMTDYIDANGLPEREVFHIYPSGSKDLANNSGPARVYFLSGTTGDGSDGELDVGKFKDTVFYVSGNIAGKDQSYVMTTNIKKGGISVFGGDLVTSGTAYLGLDVSEIQGHDKQILMVGATSITGSDVGMFFSGSKSSQGDLHSFGVSLFGGDVYVSGTLYSDDLTVVDDLTVGDDLLLNSDGAVISFGEHAEVSLAHVHNQGLYFTSTSATTNSVVRSLGLFHYTSGTPAVGLGTGLEFNLESLAGTTHHLGDIDFVYTNVGDGTEAADFKVSLSTGGASPVERFKVSSAGDVCVRSDGAGLEFGADGEVTLTHVHNTGLLLSDDSGIGVTKLMFGDSDCFIHQSADSEITIDGDDYVRLVADTAVRVQGTPMMVDEYLIANYGEAADGDFKHYGKSGQNPHGEKKFNIWSDAESSQVLILSGGKDTDPNEAAYPDMAFFVSGAIGGKDVSSGHAAKGVAVFGGDTFISGGLFIAGEHYPPPNPNYLIHIGDSNGQGLTSIEWHDNGYSKTGSDLSIYANLTSANWYFANRKTDGQFYFDTNMQGAGRAGSIQRSLLEMKSDTSNPENCQVFFLSGAMHGPEDPDEGTYTDLTFFVSGSTATQGTSEKGTALFGGDLVTSGALYVGSNITVGAGGTHIEAIAADGEVAVAVQPNITTLAALSSFGAAGTTTNIVAGDLTMYNTVTNGNPSISLGATSAERLVITAEYDSGAQTLDSIIFSTACASSTDNKGAFIFDVDGTEIFEIQDDGIIPSATATFNLGSDSVRWANIYTSDLHLKNERGDWTVIEEEEYLSLRNNKTGKRYKFLLEEIGED